MPSRILKEWLCSAHGRFENASGKCPAGCSKRFVVQEIRSAPSLRSRGTKIADSELNSLAKDYRLTDIKTGDDGESVMTMLRKKPSFAPTWGQVDHAAPGYSQRGEPAKTFDVGAAGAQPGVNVQALKPLMPGPRPLFTHKPRD